MERVVMDRRCDACLCEPSDVGSLPLGGGAAGSLWVVLLFSALRSKRQVVRHL